MKIVRTSCLLLLFLFAPGFVSAGEGESSSARVPLQVVATLPDYAMVTEAIGGERVLVQAIVRGDQDAHFIRPKPSFVDPTRSYSPRPRRWPGGRHPGRGPWSAFPAQVASMISRSRDARPRANICATALSVR